MNKSHNWVNVLKIIIPYFIIAGVFQLIGIWISGEDIRQVLPKSTFQETIVNFFGLAGTMLTVWLFCRYVDKCSFSSLGFYNAYIKRDIFYGLIMGLVIMVVGTGTLLAAGQLQYRGIYFKFTDLFCSIILYIFVAITEELLLRGYVLNNLMASMNRYVALAISAAIFSLMHAANPHIGVLPFINLFLAGILLGLSYAYTRKLWFPIALHFSWNFCQGVLCGFHVSGMDLYNFTLITRTHNTIWNGGKFGFEGSFTCIIFQVVAIGVVHKIYSTKTSEQPVDEDAELLQQVA